MQAASAPALQVPVALLQLHTGFYSALGDEGLWVRLQGAQLLLRQDKPLWQPLIALTPTRFTTPDGQLEIEFDGRPGQRANALALRVGGSVAVLRRAPDPAPAFANVPFYLRGSMNDWSATQRMEPVDLQQYSATLSLPAGQHEFKLGSQDWQSVDLGGQGDAPALVPGRKAVLTRSGANLVLKVERAGRYRFVLDTERPMIPVVTVLAEP